ncbi:MAG: zinc ribbon domain-containing protein [Candidatus Methanoplasma sp.]|jgi:TM2 domain-containing membrane protein YozV|nr:zinc ribbon domain-containing protein [Candidatus Methanoplasma sp.]
MYCIRCGKEIDDGVQFCPGCGGPTSGNARPPPYGGNYQAPPYGYQLPLKNTGVAVILAFLFTGLGHLYIGKIKRGIAVLIGGILLPSISLVLFLPFLIVDSGGATDPAIGAFLALLIVVGLIDVIYWIWNIVDAYNLAKEYNDVLRNTGNPPW